MTVWRHSQTPFIQLNGLALQRRAHVAPSLAGKAPQLNKVASSLPSLSIESIDPASIHSLAAQRAQKLR